MTCPRCSSTSVYSNAEYVWYCQKCCRHEVRPLETELPFRQSMKEKQKYEKHMTVAVCTMCGKDFEKMPTTKRDVCTRCQNILFQRARSKAKRGGNAQAIQSAHNGKISGGNSATQIQEKGGSKEHMWNGGRESMGGSRI
jgi:DNA-directed RNA polymerase subunit RPC12/RpoP